MDEDYLKMVLALPDEFFEGWEWKEGDRGIITWPDFENNEILITNIRARRFEFRCVESGNLEITFDFRGARPIPSQEQLQDLAMKKMSWTPDKLAQMFIFWVERQTDGDEFWTFVSWDVAWLKVYMFIVGNKVWNGESWI